MPLIVNFSAIHTLHPISKSVEAFARICDRYSTSCWSSCCPSFFQSWTNFAWVMYQYNAKYKELIEPYRLGQIDTDQFLQNLASIFNFLDDQEIDLLADDNAGSVNYSNDPKLALIEKAWNTSIDLDESTISRFRALANQSEPVYLVSNTNELNVLAILALLKIYNPEIHFNTDIDLSVTEDKKPIEIAPNIFLCLSYRYQLFKTISQNESANPHSTMSLLNYLVENELQSPSANIQVISQYDGDLEEAKRIGIPTANCHSAEAYFTAAMSEVLIS